MNRKDLIRIRIENKAKLEPSSWKNINRLEFSFSNDPDKSESIEHKLAKSICYILLRNGVLAEVLPKLNSDLWDDLEFGEIDTGLIREEIRNHGQKFKKEWERPVVVTEARFKPIQKGACSFGEKMFQIIGGTDIITRRADLFILDTGECVEIETDHKIKKENAITVYI